jgi:hypothetical protein
MEKTMRILREIHLTVTVYPLLSDRTELERDWIK